MYYVTPIKLRCYKMKKRILVIFIITGILFAPSCSRNNSKEFSYGNLRYASDLGVSSMSDYNKDGIKLYEVYADRYVFSFKIDLAPIMDNFGIALISKDNEYKYYGANNVGSIWQINYPAYNKDDRLILGELKEKDGVYYGDIEIPLKDILPDLISEQETAYTSGTTFLYNDELFKVDSLIRTDCYCVLKFDKELADPGKINKDGDASVMFYDKDLKNFSSYLYDDYTFYLYDHMIIDNVIYMKVGDYNMYAIKLDRA